MKYFKVNLTSYEDSRFLLDNLLNVPEGDTFYTPASAAPKDPSNNVLISFRTEHYTGSLEEVFGGLLAEEKATELTESEYNSALPPQSM